MCGEVNTGRERSEDPCLRDTEVESGHRGPGVSSHVMRTYSSTMIFYVSRSLAPFVVSVEH